jgi:hypothetical protein
MCLLSAGQTTSFSATAIERVPLILESPILLDEGGGIHEPNTDTSLIIASDILWDKGPACLVD